MAESEEVVRCIGAEGSFTFPLTPGVSVRDLAAQVALAADQPKGSHVRLLCCGRELRHYELASVIGAHTVVHYLVGCESGSVSRESSCELAGAFPLGDDDSCLDALAQEDAWIDSLDPSALLMGVFAVVLGLFWIAFLTHPTMFDSASTAMLITMTVACVLPSVYQRAPRIGSWISPRRPANDGCYDYNPTAGPSTTASWRQQQEASYAASNRATSSSGSASIPPRPQARLVGPRSG